MKQKSFQQLLTEDELKDIKGWLPSKEQAEKLLGTGITREVLEEIRDWAIDSIKETFDKEQYCVQVATQGRVLIGGVEHIIRGNQAFDMQGNEYTIDDNGQLKLKRQQGYIVAQAIHGSGMIPRSSPPVFVKSSLNTKIESPKSCGCGGAISDYQGNQVCDDCGRFYGITKS